MRRSRIQGPEMLHNVALRTMALEFDKWDWGDAIAIEGLLAAYRATNETSYLEYVEHLFQVWIARTQQLTHADHMVPGNALLDLYELTDTKLYLDFSCRLADLLMNAEQSEVSGAYFYRSDVPEFTGHMWVDALQIGPPFLAHLGQVTGENAYFSEAIKHAIHHLRALQDLESGLFSHLWDESIGRSNGVHWSRGNGWALMGLVQTLLRIPSDLAGRDELMTSLHRLLASFLKLQDGGGHWHIVADRLDTYLESSAAAFVCAALPPAIAGDLVDRNDCEDTLKRCWSGLNSFLDNNGSLWGVSVATWPGDVSHYNAQPVAVQKWGQGPLLLALAQELKSEI